MVLRGCKPYRPWGSLRVEQQLEACTVRARDRDTIVREAWVLGLALFSLEHLLHALELVSVTTISV
ncbi:hypothetical protein E2562_004155 [Oryza meyeriana var. granulata]|uniref:Uncharacterized protein n=1 Tax=Oryza meyeriana var. granulata TaxID=110450 RepID=A0A6G1BRE4_9ORYZ|nr:hypothetical protein E2562_004155 [Oryza meyeriana var. granulata]